MKVTSILQFCPAASVEPQGLVLVVRLKSPLGTTLVILNDAFPVLARIMPFAVLVAPTTVWPNTREAGVSVTAGPVPAVTVS